MIALQPLFSHLYVRHRACDKYRVYLKFLAIAWLTFYIRRTLARLMTIQFVYLTTPPARASIIFNYTELGGPLVYSPWNLSDTELTQ